METVNPIQVNNRSNYAWWAIFFLLLYIVSLGLFLFSYIDPIAGLLSSGVLKFIDHLFPRSVGLAWIKQIAAFLLYAFFPTLPLLFFRYRKSVFAFTVVVLFGNFLYSLSEIPDGFGYLALVNIFVLGELSAVFLGLVILVLIQWRIKLAGTWGVLVASFAIIIESVAAIFLSSLLIYTSVVASELSTNQSLCAKMEQVTQVVKPWREYFRQHCTLGLGEQFSFPTISDSRLKQEAKDCKVQRVFESPSGLSGICLYDRSGFLTSNKELVNEEFTKAHLDRPCDTLEIDFRYGGSEEQYLVEMKKLCIAPK